MLRRIFESKGCRSVPIDRTCTCEHKCRKVTFKGSVFLAAIDLHDVWVHGYFESEGLIEFEWEVTEDQRRGISLLNGKNSLHKGCYESESYEETRMHGIY